MADHFLISESILTFLVPLFAPTVLFFKTLLLLLFSWLLNDLLPAGVSFDFEFFEFDAFLEADETLPTDSFLESCSFPTDFDFDFDYFDFDFDLDFESFLLFEIDSSVALLLFLLPSST